MDSQINDIADRQQSETVSPELTSYDKLPYSSHPFECTHPDHLATMAALFGMPAPDVDNCRVLELGAAAGGNLIPQAVALPRGRFLGVDLSQRQVAEGRKRIDELGLKNVELQHRSILDIGPDDGTFDYIICHGVFSWVAPDVQEQILEVCSRNLAPNGVAYISYNTYPGWFLRGMVRQMMCFHARQFPDPATQVEQARALLDFLIDASPGSDETYDKLLRRELQILRKTHDSYLFHEHLEEDNEPLFFYQFMERAGRHGLRFLAEAQFSEMVPSNFSAEAEKTLRDLGVGLVHSEQYLDFLRNRTFRRTLLCHESAELNRHIGPERLMELHITSQLKPPNVYPDLHQPVEMQFTSPGGPVISVAQPLVKSALVQLARLAPASVPFKSLPALAHEGLSGPLVREASHVAQDLKDLGSLVLELYTADLLELRTRPQRFQTDVEDRPLASPLARLQARDGPVVTNLKHELISLTDLQRRLIGMLDGTCDTGAMCEALEKWIDDGELVVEQTGRQLDATQSHDFLVQLIAADLKNLAHKGLLIRTSPTP